MAETLSWLLGTPHKLDQSVTGNTDATAHMDALDIAILYKLIGGIAAYPEYRGHLSYS